MHINLTYDKPPLSWFQGYWLSLSESVELGFSLIGYRYAY